MTHEEVLNAALTTASQLAGSRLRQLDARLYSQHSRLRSQQAGLPSWRQQEALDRLDDAVLLIDTGLMLRTEGRPEWRDCIRRAGDLLEWLAHPGMQLETIPVRLLSAAAYDLARFPARAYSLLRDATAAPESAILRSFLRGDYPTTIDSIRLFWETRPANTQDQGIPGIVVEETIRAIGIVCAELRWGGEPRRTVALEKLSAVAQIYTADRDSYSWLLARLTSEVCRESIRQSWRTLLSELAPTASPLAVEAFDRYARSSFLLRRALAWPSQEEGVRRMASPGSFALCTPTGSGKTAVAEIAILQAALGGDPSDPACPLCLYLVPSRALAAEVEGKLTKVLRTLTTRNVVVTGLYGGTDWGPTDAWLTVDDPTVLICTYEKAEALIRFVGPLFLGRLSLVVLDEAHAVQFDGNFNGLRQSESRPLRLESLAMRLMQLVSNRSCRVIALSAVAAGIEEPLHRWVGGDANDAPVRVPYRSTRQLIGRLETVGRGPFSMSFDLLDGHSLYWSADPEASPYVPSPIPPCPQAVGTWSGPEKELRPALLWAALHFAAPDDVQERHAVLIAVMQKIGGYAKDFLTLLEGGWPGVQLPSAFDQPTDPHKLDLWNRCLLVCADYFGTGSYEYRLLQYGIAVHHSSMPKLLTRLLIETMQEGLIWIVVATSTLSEGVNIPVETILVPSLLRGSGLMKSAEFRNLAGRAGRPGVATEGRTLVVVRPKSTQRDTARERYVELLNQLIQATPAAAPESPISNVLTDIWNEWCILTGGNDHAAYFAWLESVTWQSLPPAQATAFGSLDALDGILLASLVEHEELRGLSDWEASLQDLWRATFTSYSAPERNREAFIHRGRAIPRVYPDQAGRRRLYHTGLPLATAAELLAAMQAIRAALSTGAPYAAWNPNQRLQYVYAVVDALASIRRFRPVDDAHIWQARLAWWLHVPGAQQPVVKEIAEWHKYISQQFQYRFSWGLGSVIGVAFDEVHDGQLEATTLADWERTGLPWIVFWLKELIAWGTHDPPAAFLLGRGLARTRSDAEALGAAYYTTDFATALSDPLDPRAIRDWATSLFPQLRSSEQINLPTRLPAEITDNSITTIGRDIRVLPLRESDGVGWLDIAGFRVARTAGLAWPWEETAIRATDFILRPAESIVLSQPYL